MRKELTEYKCGYSGKVFKIGDVVTPFSEYHMKRIHGVAYGGGYWNSTPEISYSFRNRMGKPHEIVKIINIYYNNEFFTCIFHLQTKKSKKELIISSDDVYESTTTKCRKGEIL